MVITQHRSKRSSTGSRFRAHRRKRKFESGNSPTLPVLGDRTPKLVRTKGGNSKLKILKEQFINLMDPNSKKASKVKIKNVVDCPANKQYTRRNILTKGTIVDTDNGKARITNRPAQDGCVAGVLVK
ncbi:MAG: 30S ribosomal protein S8e [Candidatus Woesearchaeota archaeon]